MSPNATGGGAAAPQHPATQQKQDRLEDIDRITAEIAAKGLARVAELEARAARLRELFAHPEYLCERAEEQLRAEQKKFAWEAGETFQPDVRPTIWAATI